MAAIVKVKTTDVGCRKPGCRHRLKRTNRHHRAQQTLFINAFRLKGKRKTDSELYKQLVKRYEEFREEDCVTVCEWHHCEIHLLYDRIIRFDQIDRGKRLRNYTWPQAKALMKKLEKECLEWEVEDTPGVDPVNCENQNRFPKRRRKHD